MASLRTETQVEISSPARIEGKTLTTICLGASARPIPRGRNHRPPTITVSNRFVAPAKTPAGVRKGMRR